MAKNSIGQRDLTSGSVLGNLLYFSIPYLISCFLQTFYGLADLFITGRFNGAESITGVSVGSQLMHMVILVIAGLAMGATVSVGNCVGARNDRGAARSIGNTVFLFAIFSVLLTVVLVVLIPPIMTALSVPAQAWQETRRYMLICFLGIPFITAYNVISSIFRGIGDTKSPMYFIAAAGVINILLDYILIGPLSMGAAGAAFATVISQTVSVVFALVFLKKALTQIRLHREDYRPDGLTLKFMLRVGVPIAVQEGLVETSFLVITAIANARGLETAAAVGIVERFIAFLFLVPSAMLSTVSAIGAQNAGAGKDDQSRRTLRYAILICVIYGAVVALICNLIPAAVVGMFTDEAEVIRLGSQYLRPYVTDTLVAGIHFCFSGFFCAYQKASYSFIHNIIAIIVMRIPGAYFASVLFPQTLLPMGLSAPAGSLISVVICLLLYRRLLKQMGNAPIQIERD